MKKTLRFSWISMLMLTLFLSGCGVNDDQAATDNKDTKKAEEIKDYTVTDDTGKKIKFEKIPEKVVSLQPSNTEILFALEQGDKVVGVTDFDNYPEEAKNIEHVSDSVNINAEKIIALKPDAIIAYTIGDEATLKPLEDAGIPVFIIKSAANFDDVYGDIGQIAKVMGVAEKGDELVKDIKSQIASVEEKVETLDEKEQTYFEISPAPEIYTTGAETFQHEILNTAGIKNIFDDQKGWVKVSDEEIVKRNPKSIITTATYADDAVGEIKSRKGWEDIDAVKNDDVHLLDENVMSRPGPRIGEAVELAAKAVYPDLFK
ncbi:ABC transporter substrate-binding protein [Peribacillus simplex]|uniref:Cobalamin-binding protein n=1 Tax=Peribacillus simplex NBRC 15720 = DSM 1321 TaxID=1349754 RepID=A0A223EGC1_9BACI|nr:ABC transporter substrate-binding protein [Peribacillus simplex]ASS94309.1 cobalamin-binding protein [Peribacillus simplex NBRC 15720 = DSM 1321]MEC1400670.1 ABC transporter substrate-binding protein [Peribacillus simplex]MED3912219.1 ABC transporter substrate-binding protein [Peribacillus simplex]MED3985986.1 ABC transporter substrate-binding protein [Peribacillus simplex]MED4097055.1 ABC transporter substrate-binding protein [Peribacillus simplex]